jgi:hypothetical protein
MRAKIVVLAVSILCLMAVWAVAADISGTWVAEMAAPKMGPGGGGPGGGPGGGGPAGPMKFTFEFKANGATLGGTVQGPMGNKNDIIDGKIDGDNVSFAVKVDAMGNEMKINYKGTVSGDEMKLTFSMEGGMGGPGGGGMPPMELVAKRQK